MTAVPDLGEGLNSLNGKQRKKKMVVFSALAVFVAVIIVSSLLYFQYRKTHVSTDDAFVDGRVYLVASKIPGTVKVLHVTDNQMVKKNDVLVEVDPADYDVKVLEAQAGFEAAKNQFVEFQASLESARANLEAQESLLHKAEIDFQRADSLVREDLVTKEFFDQKKTGLDVARAQVKAARELVRKTEASLGTQKAVIRHARSSLQGATLNQSYTKISAPADGYVTKRNVEVGNRVQTGQPLLAVVSLSPGDVWITANYKETDLTRVKPGQKVRVKVDTYPGRVLHGRVESIMAGTGSAFSLFPPENATGNYVKVVQRIPVKIVLDEANRKDPVLRIGMSVVPTILTDQ
ncbi:MAG TPA: HlyD family secretion protein [Syntrophales bacterium]|jgi:membrane fusion protein (multidrug efflux system)|nr:HlyD family secretion protein [Syntrophales bacterium]